VENGCISIKVMLKGVMLKSTAASVKKKTKAKTLKNELASKPLQGRKAVISREDIINAALELLGPHRSISSLSLREIARSADIAPNSFYRHFKDLEELNLALIKLAGQSLHKIVGEARHRVTVNRSVVRTSIEALMDMLNADQKLLHILLREGTIGSENYKKAVQKELQFFEDELCMDLIRLLKASGHQIKYPDLVAKAITRLVFTIGVDILDKPKNEQPPVVEELIKMIRMIIIGGVSKS